MLSLPIILKYFPIIPIILEHTYYSKSNASDKSLTLDAPELSLRWGYGTVQSQTLITELWFFLASKQFPRSRVAITMEVSLWKSAME